MNKLAEKKVFFTDNEDYFREEIITYKYYSGFAISQKQKSIRSLHEAIKEKYPHVKILEISTKSENVTGTKASAFNLNYYYKELDRYINIENVFQSSKVFRNGGPYRDLLYVSATEAKRDERLHNSGELIGFELNGEIWPLEPKSIFYDWLYISALKDNMELGRQLAQYNCFTDIEFNHKKSINCQARSAAIFVSLYKKGILNEKTVSLEKFQSLYIKEDEQIGMF